MSKLSIIKFLSLLLCFCSPAFADDVLQADQAFQLTAEVKPKDRLLLAWDIADGYYLYRQKLQFISLTPGIKTEKPLVPTGQIKHDNYFGNVDIFRNHLDVEIPLQRQNPNLNKLLLAVTYQGCADAGICYMPIKKTISFDLSDEAFNW